MTAAGKVLADSSNRATESLLHQLLVDEAVCMTLFGLVHIEENKSKMQTIASVHLSLMNWAVCAERLKVAQSFRNGDAILIYGIQILRETHPGYAFRDCEQAAVEIAKKNDKGRGPDAENVVKISEECAARKLLYATNDQNDPKDPMLAHQSKDAPTKVPSEENAQNKRKDQNSLLFSGKPCGKTHPMFDLAKQIIPAAKKAPASKAHKAKKDPLAGRQPVILQPAETAPTTHSPENKVEGPKKRTRAKSSAGKEPMGSRSEKEVIRSLFLIRLVRLQFCIFVNSLTCRLLNLSFAAGFETHGYLM